MGKISCLLVGCITFFLDLYGIWDAIMNHEYDGIIVAIIGRLQILPGSPAWQWISTLLWWGILIALNGLMYLHLLDYRKKYHQEMMHQLCGPKKEAHFTKDGKFRHCHRINVKKWRVNRLSCKPQIK